MPGILLGVGLGGFVDGIVLHQLLQWHHMLTSEGSYPKDTVAGLEANTFWDGVFHVSTWITVLIGIWILWRRTNDWHWAIDGRAFIGWMLVGWGLFNVVEGVVDHHILTLHHVREGVSHQWAYDYAVLILVDSSLAEDGFLRALPITRRPIIPRRARFQVCWNRRMVVP
jgi:uncharacterized membrane protein